MGEREDWPSSRIGPLKDGPLDMVTMLSDRESEHLQQACQRGSLERIELKVVCCPGVPHHVRAAHRDAHYIGREHPSGIANSF